MTASTSTIVEATKNQRIHAPGRGPDRYLEEVRQHMPVKIQHVVTDKFRSVAKISTKLSTIRGSIGIVKDLPFLCFKAIRDSTPQVLIPDQAVCFYVNDQGLGHYGITGTGIYPHGVPTQ